MKISSYFCEAKTLYYNSSQNLKLPILHSAGYASKLE